MSVMHHRIINEPGSDLRRVIVQLSECVGKVDRITMTTRSLDLELDAACSLSLVDAVRDEKRSIHVSVSVRPSKTSHEISHLLRIPSQINCRATAA